VLTLLDRVQNSHRLVPAIELHIEIGERETSIVVSLRQRFEMRLGLQRAAGRDVEQRQRAVDERIVGIECETML
jgi:hypothetical protein